jgi:DNA repair photolyase
MTNRIVVVPTPDSPIKPSPGFSKKQLSDYKLDLCGLCAFGCQYCSSIHGNYLRIRRGKFADLTQQQLGVRVLPQDDPSLMFAWTDGLCNLEQQLQDAPAGWGEGHTLVFSMLTDGFSPPLVEDGTTLRALELVLKFSRFRIRVLTEERSGWLT